jgi:hypothetical protein
MEQRIENSGGFSLINNLLIFGDACAELANRQLSPIN